MSRPPADLVSSRRRDACRATGTVRGEMIVRSARDQMRWALLWVTGVEPAGR